MSDTQFNDVEPLPNKTAEDSDSDISRSSEGPGDIVDEQPPKYDDRRTPTSGVHVDVEPAASKQHDKLKADAQPKEKMVVQEEEIRTRAAGSSEGPDAELADITFLSSVGQIPLAAAAVEQATALYTWAKTQNEYVRMGLERGENITKKGAAALTSTTIVQNISTRLQPLDSAAGQKLEKLKKSYPMINTPPEEIFQTTRQRLAELSPRTDYAHVARQAEDLLKSQLQQNYDIAKAKTSEVIKTMQDQTQALVDYSKGLNLEQATHDIKKAFESVQEYVSSTLAGAQLTAKNQASAAKATIETHVTAMQNSQVLAPLQQQLEGLKAQLDGLVDTVKSSLTPQQLGVLESLHGLVEEAVKSWFPVKDHLLAYFVAQHDEPHPVEASTPASPPAGL